MLNRFDALDMDASGELEEFEIKVGWIFHGIRSRSVVFDCSAALTCWCDDPLISEASGEPDLTGRRRYWQLAISLAGRDRRYNGAHGSRR